MLKPPAEKRQFGRRPTSSFGWIRIGGRPSIPCNIANLSQGGALLVLQTQDQLPFRFRLIIETEGIDSYCEIRHQTGNRVGIEFVKEAALAKPLERASFEEGDAWNGARRR